MRHVKDKKYTYYLFLGTVVQQMIQRFLESLACTLEKSDQRMSMARILFKSPLNPWSICLLVIAPNIPTTIKFSHREHTCEHCNFCRSTCNCFFPRSFLFVSLPELLEFVPIEAKLDRDVSAIFGIMSIVWLLVFPVLTKDFFRWRWSEDIKYVFFIFSSPEIRL